LDFDQKEMKMFKWSVALVLAVTACLIAGASAVSRQQNQTQSVNDEQTIWNLEHTYWSYAQDQDLTRYLALWKEDALAWPLSYPAPPRKAHVADWITTQRSKGMTLKIVEIKPAGIQITGSVAVTYYWITYGWVDKDGKGDMHTFRITHTWLNDGKDWHILSGMSAAEPATP
jgi:ketosteroid isomerase-like protein